MPDEFGAAVGDALQTAGGLWQNSLGRKIELQKLAQQMKLEAMREELRAMTAHLTADSRERVAETGARSRIDAANVAGNYGMQRQRLSNAGGVDRARVAGEYGLDRQESANRGGIDRATVSGKFGLQRQNSANAGAMARTRLTTGTARDIASGNNAAADTRSLRSLYGTMFRPRPADPLADDATPAPPKLNDWMAGNRPLLDENTDEPTVDDMTDDPAADEPPADEPAPPPRRAAPASRPALAPMKPVASHTTALPAQPGATTKVVTGEQLDAFAKSSKRTRPQAEQYARDHGWSIQ